MLDRGQIILISVLLCIGTVFMIGACVMAYLVNDPLPHCIVLSCLALIMAILAAGIFWSLRAVGTEMVKVNPPEHPGVAWNSALQDYAATSTAAAESIEV